MNGTHTHTYTHTRTFRPTTNSVPFKTAMAETPKCFVCYTRTFSQMSVIKLPHRLLLVEDGITSGMGQDTMTQVPNTSFHGTVEGTSTVERVTT